MPEIMKSALFNVKYRCFRGEAFDLANHLKKSQLWSRDQWRDYHIRKRKELVLRAFRESAFYAKWYGDAGFQAGDAEQDGYFERLPVLTKEHVRNHFSNICNQRLGKFLGRSSTGGSTGVPAAFGYDRRFPFEAFAWRMMTWWGVHPWDNGAYVWRNPRTSWQARIINQLLWWPTRKIRFDASSMSQESMDDFIGKINHVKPRLLQGYVGAVDELARYVLANGRRVHAPVAVWLTSAPLVSIQRNQIELAFKAPAYDQYGCCEVPNIAAQCGERNGLHVNAEWVSLEFVDERDQPVPGGVWGRTLVTKYDDFVFPLIRYEVGDVGRYLPVSCSCGRTLPLIDGVKGRTTDLVRLPSGRVISGEYLTTIFDAHPDFVRGFRVVQQKDASLRIEYLGTAEREMTPVISALQRTLDEKVCHEVPVRFVRVDEIPHDRGKLRFVVREV